MLDQKLYRRLVLWIRRTRTVEGCKLLAHTQFFSVDTGSCGCTCEYRLEAHLDVAHQDQTVHSTSRCGRSASNSSFYVGCSLFRIDVCTKIERTVVGWSFPRFKRLFASNVCRLCNNLSIKFARVIQVGSTGGTVAVRLLGCVLGDFRGSSASDVLFVGQVECRSES